MTNTWVFSKKQILLACFTFILILKTDVIHAQVWGFPTASIDTAGDTTWQSFPPPDSTYIHNKIAIKFRRGALDYSQLCYDCDTIVTDSAFSSDTNMIFPKCKETLMAQQFSTTVILDPTCNLFSAPMAPLIL